MVRPRAPSTRRLGPLVDVLPASPDLTERDTETARTNPQDRLRRALAGITDPYDVVLIDCPPSLGLNSRSALVAADYVLLVTEPSVLGTQGLAAATEFIDEVWHATTASSTWPASSSIGCLR